MSNIHKVRASHNKTITRIHSLSQRKSILVKKPIVKAPSTSQSEKLDRIHISHELRIALTGILGSSYLLEQTLLNEQQKELLKLLNTAANRLLVLANEF